jgi:hypothetical protein
MTRICWSRLDASRDSTAVRRTRGPGWARCVACRCGSRDTTTRGWAGRGRGPPLPLSSRSCGHGGRRFGGRTCFPPSQLFLHCATQTANSYFIPCGITSPYGITRCRRLKFPNWLFVSRLRERTALVEFRIFRYRSQFSKLRYRSFVTSISGCMEIKVPIFDIEV